MEVMRLGIPLKHTRGIVKYMCNSLPTSFPRSLLMEYYKNPRFWFFGKGGRQGGSLEDLPLKTTC